jgi:hypothetical protein
MKLDLYAPFEPKTIANVIRKVWILQVIALTWKS